MEFLARLLNQASPLHLETWHIDTTTVQLTLRVQSTQQQRAAQRQARRQSAYEQVWALHRQGWSVATIARHMRMSQHTVQRDLRTATDAA